MRLLGAVSQGSGKVNEDGWGFAGKLGFQYKVGPQWRIGATYTTESSIDLDDGDAELNFGGKKVTYDAKMEDFTWPQEVEFGAAYLPIKGLTLAADVKWINWSATIDKPKLKLSSPNAPVPPGYDSISQEFDMNWDDQWVFAIGAEYAINEVHTVRCGFNYGNNPVPDEQLNPLFPAIVTTHLTLGYGANFGKWSMDVAYEHAFEESQENPNGTEIDHSQNTVSFAATYRY